MSFWISQDLAHLNTLSSRWHFCVYFWQAQAFRCISWLRDFFNIWLSILFWQRRIEISWYLNYLISFSANLYRNNHRITSILLSLGSIGVDKVEIYRLSFVKWPRGLYATWLYEWDSLTVSHHPAKFGVHRPCESGDITSLICHVTTQSMYHVTLWVRFPYPKSPPCQVWGP